MSLDLSNRPRFNENFSIRETDDGAILESAQSNRTHYINAAAAYILSLCDGNATVAQITDEFARQFGMGAEAKDLVIEALAQFSAEGILNIKQL